HGIQFSCHHPLAVLNQPQGNSHRLGTKIGAGRMPSLSLNPQYKFINESGERTTIHANPATGQTIAEMKTIALPHPMKNPFPDHDFSSTTLLFGRLENATDTPKRLPGIYNCMLQNRENHR